IRPSQTISRDIDCHAMPASLRPPLDKRLDRVHHKPPPPPPRIARLFSQVAIPQHFRIQGSVELDPNDVD
ncbi:hypothetical protein AVEN_202866-1, partial [Araneus ventricosus]